MSQKETVEVTVKVPKGIMQFLDDIKGITWFKTVNEYLEDEIISRVEGDIENDCFTPKLKEVVEQYNLEGVFDS